MKKILLFMGLLSVMALSTIAAGPYRTVADIKAAIAANEPQQLEAHINFDTLRANLKAQLRERLGALSNSQERGLHAMASGFGGWLVDGMVDTLVTPSGLAALMAGRSYLAPQRGADGDVEADDLLADARYGYDSLNHFSVSVPTEGGRETRFVLERRGWDWQLIDVQLAGSR